MDDVLTLIGKSGTTTRDKDGNVIYQHTENTVFCKVRSVTMREYYEAATQDLKPELVFTISHRVDYEGQNELMYHGEMYVVTRTYWRDDEVELTAAPKIGVKGVIASE